MNSALTAIITSLVIGILFWFAQRKAKKLEAEMDEGDFIIRQPKFALVLYIIVSIPLFIVLIVLATIDYDPDTWEGLLVAWPFLLLGPFFTVLWLRYKIVVKGNQITSRTYFGKERTYAFDYITTVKRGPVATRGGSLDTIIAYHGKKKLFGVSEICPGFNILASRLESEGVPVIGIKDKIF